MSRPARAVPSTRVRILGVDPGSRITGYAVVDSDGGRAPAVRYLECGVLATRAGDAVERRLGEIARGLQEILEELAPDVVAVEDLFYGVSARSALALGQARGVALAIAGMAGLPVFSYAPAVVKKAITGRGRADKLQVALMVKALVGLRTVPRADAADALAVAVAHAHLGRDLGAVASRGRPQKGRA